MFKLLLSMILISSSASAFTVKRLGKSCQVCSESGSIKVCKFHKRCPIKEEKKKTIIIREIIHERAPSHSKRQKR